MKTVSVFGSTGSIGENALCVIAAHPELFRVQALTCNSNIEKLRGQIARFRPEYACVSNVAAAAELKAALPSGCKTEILAGADKLEDAAVLKETDIVVAGLVGTAGLRPTLASIRAGKTVALANKEVMVMAGELVNRLAHENGATVIPVDSEHSAIFQCLASGKPEQVERLIITGSGGPFFRKDIDLGKVTPEQACNHPKWKMGRKISVDSATLMNKCLEIIEARWLFDIASDRISLLIHPESIVHSLVEYIDGSVIAQLGLPDMRMPIQYALSWPDRLGAKDHIKRLSLADAASLSFFEPPAANRRALELCRRALEAGKTFPAVMSSANEEAVCLFLDGKIGFTRIVETVERVMDAHEPLSGAGLEEIIQLDTQVRKQVTELCRH